MKKEIKLYGTIGLQIRADQFVNTLSELEQIGCTDLTIHLHSQGGDVIEGNVIFNAIQRTPIHTKIIIDGLAASMAGIIILSADEVEICENAFVMIHRPYTNGGGNADDIESTAKVLRSMETTFINCIVTKTAMTEEQIKTKFFNNSDCWLNADEAVQYGFATRKIASLAKVQNITQTEQMSIENIYNRFSASLNNDNQKSMKKKLIDKFNLVGVTEESSDDEIIQQLSEKFETLKKQTENSTEEIVNSMLLKARQDCKITATQEQTYKQIGLKNGISALSEVLNNTNRMPSITATLQAYKQHTPEHKAQGKDKDRREWTLEDYRKYAPQELRANPQLYAKLADQEFGK